MEGTRREIYAGDDAETDVGAETLGLLLEVGHELRSVHPLGIAGEILDLGGRGELAARLDAFVKHRLQVGARGIDGSREPRGAAADNQTFYTFHYTLFSGCCKFYAFSSTGSSCQTAVKGPCCRPR